MSTHENPSPTERPPAGSSRMRRIGAWPAIGIGIVAAGLVFAVGELVAAIGSWIGALDPSASPFAALGAAFIAITPAWLKDFGIGLFGQNDKFALAISMIGTFVILGVLIGLIGRINRIAATALGAVLVLVTGVAIVTRPDVGVGSVVSILLGGAAGIWFLLRVLRPVDDPYPATRARLASGGAERTVVPGDGATASAAAPDSASGESSSAARPVDRRKVLRMTGIGAVLALAAGGLSRVVPNIANVQADRAGVTLPPVGTGSSSTAAGSALTGTGSSTTSAGSSSPSSPSLSPATAPDLPPLPADVNPPVPGVTDYITPNEHFFRIDTAFTLPKVTTDEWRLKVHGLVDEPFEITWDELLAMPQVQRTITLTCVSNQVGGELAGNAVWQGVSIGDLLARAKLQDGADCLYTTSADNFSVATPLGVFTDGRDSLLAIGMNGSPLPIEHGFPARIVVPGLYGYVANTKWVTDLEVTKFSEVSGYWTHRGWSARGPIKTASRIDTPGYDVTVPGGVVPVAGVAWAQHRGIKKVQVQVDDGPWQDAELSGAASADTWRQWVFRWNTTEAGSGKHTLQCRAIDGIGAIQDATFAPPAPNGASGYDQIPVVVK